LIPVQVLVVYPMACQKLEALLAQMHKANQPLALTGSLPWLFTLEAFIRPSLYGRGLDVWRQLARGMPHVNDCVAEMGMRDANLTWGALTNFQRLSVPVSQS
jgi:hypothetical protein